MSEQSLVDTDASSRQLIRNLRVTISPAPDVLPESLAWHTFIELRRRGDTPCDGLFISALRNLHSRRCISGVDLPTQDSLPNEHRMTEDPFLADLWKAYKKCIRNNRTGPASQLLRDIEERIAQA
ncbi:MAG: hypothetical protein GWP91_20795 [Rhodobacterales bacterium]|nr:hypothetical protein [Rhodobacterales bacterium]